MQKVLGWPSGQARVPARWMNQSLLWLTKIEKAVLEPIHPPFGTSLMVVVSRQPAD